MTVADARGRRWDAATGLVFAVLAIAAGLIPGQPATADDSITKVRDFLVGNRDDLLLGNLLFALSAFFFLWFLGSLRSYLRASEGGEGRLSAAAFGGGVTGVALALAGTAVISGVAVKVAKDGSADVTQALYDVGNFMFLISGPAFAAFFAATACSGARSGALPSWLVWTAALAAVLEVLTTFGLLADSGAFQYGDIVNFVTLLVSTLWVAAASVVLFRREGVPPVVRADP
jgi:hypothetical protein